VTQLKKRDFFSDLSLMS